MTPYYEHAGITIYHGDCREILPTLGTFDLLLADPPYGINADSAAAKNHGKWGWTYYGESSWDKERPSTETFAVMRAATTNQIIWGGNYFADLLPPSQGWLVWDKGQREFSLADGELAWTSFDAALRIVNVSRASALKDHKEHPTQKALSVMEWCLKYADRNAAKPVLTIIDPFAGAGSTLIAAKLAGRIAVGIEAEERYCEIAAKRLSQEVLPLGA